MQAAEQSVLNAFEVMAEHNEACSMRDCGPSHIRHESAATGTPATASLYRDVTHYLKAFRPAVLHSLRSNLKGVMVSATMAQIHEIVFATRILNLRQDRRVGAVGKTAMIERYSRPRPTVHAIAQSCHDLAATDCVRTRLSNKPRD